MNQTLDLAKPYEYEGKSYGPGTAEFDMSKPEDRFAFDAISRTVATESEGGRTVAAKPDPEPKPKPNRKVKPEADNAS
jgi:hypothetical protein